MACPCSQYRQGAGVAASRSQPPERATKHASTQPSGMSSTWKSPGHLYRASQEKYPTHQPVHDNFILSGLKGPGEGRGKFTGTALMWVPRDHFLNERQRKGGKRERGRERFHRQIHLENCHPPYLRFTIRNDILKALRSPAAMKLAYTASMSQNLWWCLFCRGGDAYYFYFLLAPLLSYITKFILGNTW